MSCDARTRGGGHCRRRPHPGRRRCVLHGGAPGSGAQAGNANARRHGRFGIDALEERRFIGALIEQSLQLLRVVERLPGHGDRPAETTRDRSRECERGPG